MATDVFNNPSNDYVNPGLAPCAGVADSAAFKFINDGAGVVSGAEILQFLDLSDISVTVTNWTGEKKTLQSGEVTYVPGLTKGLLNKIQVFDILTNSSDGSADYFMTVDLSINYYYNFRYYQVGVDASANYGLNIDIDDALNIQFGAQNIDVTATYDPSTFTFTGDAEGYDFDITNMVLTFIDASENASSPFPAVIDASGVRTPQTFTLIEDTSSAVPSANYPNGGMLGYLLKSTFPSTACENDSWMYMSHVVSPYVVFETADLPSLDPSVYYEKFSKAVEVGRNADGTSTILSASEYLDYINTNGLWDKVGKFASRFSATDSTTTYTKNLIGGFYLFNPQTFSIQVEYMLLNNES